MDAETRGFETWIAGGLPPIDELELGSLVAALSAATEDEVELDDRVRLLVESGGFRIAVGSEPAFRQRGN